MPKQLNCKILFVKQIKNDPDRLCRANYLFTAGTWGQTAHHCGTKWSNIILSDSEKHHVEQSEMHHIGEANASRRQSRCFIWQGRCFCFHIRPSPYEPGGRVVGVPRNQHCEPKKISVEKPGNHNGFRVFSCHFSRWNSKDIISRKRPLGRTWTKFNRYQGQILRLIS